MVPPPSGRNWQQIFQNCLVFQLKMFTVAFVVSALSVAVSAEPAPNVGIDGPSNDPEISHLDADDPDFSGVVDFSNAVPGPGGSWCITKMKYVEHMVKDQVRISWIMWIWINWIREALLKWKAQYG